MSFIGNLVGDVLGGITGAKQSGKAAVQAANTQAASADSAIAEQRAARLSNEQRQQPFVDAGAKSLAQQMSLLGLNGTADQQSAISALLTSPQYTTATRQGEEAILANASATGGLRGGNTNNSLARFRSDLLSSTISDQLARLGNVTSLGQNAAAGVGNAGLAAADSISRLLESQGDALAGGQIAKGNVTTRAINTATQIAGTIAGF